MTASTPPCSTAPPRPSSKRGSPSPSPAWGWNTRRRKSEMNVPMYCISITFTLRGNTSQKLYVVRKTMQEFEERIKSETIAETQRIIKIDRRVNNINSNNNSRHFQAAADSFAPPACRRRSHPHGLGPRGHDAGAEAEARLRGDEAGTGGRREGSGEKEADMDGGRRRGGGGGAVLMERKGLRFVSDFPHQNGTFYNSCSFCEVRFLETPRLRTFCRLRSSRSSARGGR